MREVSDDALLAGFSAGDRSAELAFVRRFQHRMFGVAVAVVGDRSLAQDVTQETFVKAWRGAATYDARRGSVLAWLLTITRHSAIDAVRARRARPLEVGDLDVRLASADTGPDERAAVTDAVGRVRDALRELPTGQRRAVVLAVYGGRTALEVAEADGIPLGTAKTRIRSGLIRLRDALGVDVGPGHDVGVEGGAS